MKNQKLEKKINDDQNWELLLRPTNWDEYVGQENTKRNLRLIIEAAKQRNEVCDHLLIYGQAGLGKTTLAYLVAKEMKANIKTTTGPSLEKIGDLAAILSNLEPGNVLFIDEAHRLNKAIEEALYPALETRRLHLVIGKGPSARTISLDLPSFTLIAATTKINLLSNPFRSRFGAILKLNYYEVSDLEKIIERSAKILNVKINKAALEKIAQSSRFTPRTANRLLKRCRDYAQVNNQPLINEEIVCQTLAMLEIDEKGLEKSDRYFLEVLIKKFNGGPVGLKTLAAALNEEIGTIEDIYEPFLMTLGMIKRTPNGRMATPLAYQHLKIDRHSIFD